MANPVLYFLLFCIPARLLITWGAATTKYTSIYSLFLLLISLGFLYLYFTGKRTMAPEAGGVTWWADYRLIIGLLYLASALYLFQGKQNIAWVPLLMDVILGFILFINKHGFLRLSRWRGNNIESRSDSTQDWSSINSIKRDQ